MSVDVLPRWCQLVVADNPGPMTLEGTNTYVLRTDDGNVVIDPGPELEAHLTHVSGLGPVALTLLTHNHRDHTGGVERFHQLTGAPVLARDPRLSIGGADLPGDGELLPVSGLDVRVVDTPGHTPDSVCFVVDDTRTVIFTGDTVLGRGTTIVPYPEGNLRSYLHSLERLRDIAGADGVLLPGHGPSRTDAAAVITGYIEHRWQRLGEVREALASGARTPREVVEIIYADVDRSVWPAAQSTVEAAMAYLREDA